DIVLAKILDLFRPYQDDLLFVYLADHGEIVSENKNGHGYSPAYQEEYRTPFILWSSHATPPWKDIKSTLASSTGVFNLDAFDHLFLYLAGVVPSYHFQVSSQVFELDRVVDYYDLLPYHTQPETPEQSLLQKIER
ncbi:MAG: sulfatase-like hydrolase/transferase, partial [Chloroflexi bacterium]|nr:sulfatase-like hydrolase/transferase [Chloroflexota bacterium]